MTHLVPSVGFLCLIREPELVSWQKYISLSSSHPPTHIPRQAGGWAAEQTDRDKHMQKHTCYLSLWFLATFSSPVLTVLQKCPRTGSSHCLSPRMRSLFLADCGFRPCLLLHFCLFWGFRVISTVTHSVHPPVVTRLHNSSAWRSGKRLKICRRRGFRSKLRSERHARWSNWIGGVLRPRRTHGSFRRKVQVFFV